MSVSILTSLRQDITTSNKAQLLLFRQNYLNPPSPPEYIYRYVPCGTAHPAVSACSSVPLDRFFAVFKWMLPIYGALHFVPPILFKWKNFLKDPGAVIVRAGLGSIRSSAFLGVFVVIYQSEPILFYLPYRFIYQSSFQHYSVTNIIFIDISRNSNLEFDGRMLQTQRLNSFHNLRPTCSYQKRPS
jgi:hypothetical protein